MCCTALTLERHATYAELSPEHIALARELYARAWPRLDHSRRYCIQPTYLARELVREATGHAGPRLELSQAKRRQYDAIVKAFVAASDMKFGTGA